ncbi:hypothetical protein SAMN05660420_00467 [Desulfuromusa kysingii]|uniref:DUF2288 domain-containing protein n=1 Tax=Desulfuromusa kysingii TaxID=37625 RepID=A0A1H3W4D7_9BACT|nr:DUF2288 domain-containing protein [Desulfuromusa kysingii]SDZ81947.1 hypothetical protein SAMN05660420_00467 [Desulfuromusa kysingii]
MSEIAESFKRDLAAVNWRELRIHLQRDAIIVVAEGLDLVTVGVAVAEDNKGLVEGWIAAHQLGKPNEPQLQSWEQEPDRRFKMLIVQPFILIQDDNNG